jgi:signal transduction histidine kinase
MRLTVTKKIALGFGLVFLIGIVSMIIIYRGLSSVKTAMDSLAKVHEPASAAAFEMEIQLHGLVVEILGFSETGNPEARERLASYDARFREFRSRYMDLARAGEGLEAGLAIGRRYDELRSLGEALIAKKEEHEALYGVVAGNFEKMDRVVDDHLQPLIGGGLRVLNVVVLRQKTEAVLDLEAEIAELGLWFATRHRVKKAEYRDRVFVRERDVRAALARLRALDLTKEEEHWTRVLEDLLRRTRALIRQALAVDAEVRQQVKAVVGLADEVERMLDDQIQAATRQELLVPTKVAERATSATIGWIRVLAPLFTLSAIGIGLLLVLAVIRPVRALATGARAVGQGDLAYRVRSLGRDELADLAREFNRMVAELESTTVSKQELEASEERLKTTVVRLREEIAERARAEREQTRLQASLRHAETMASLGSLVAGVAHEVRNPLFGISSVLDAMDARFGDRQEYQRYARVLREPVDRLTELMKELLEYGRPPTAELVPVPIEEVIEEAVHGCGRLAESVGAKIAVQTNLDGVAVRMDRPRLVRAFSNIVQNALQHSASGSTVGIESWRVAASDGERMQCTVVDSGPGIASEDLPRIFEPFFTRRRGGTGLGLSIVQRIVEEHGGLIDAGNRAEGGAVMTVTLPIAPIERRA